MKKESPRTKNKGFTFIEVLTALIFVAIVLPVALKGISLASSVTAETKHRQIAAGLAENLLAEIVSAGSFENLAGEGDFFPDYPEYHWNITLDDWQQAGVKELTLTVSWLFRGKKREISLATLVCDHEQ